jgi:hypothetical protein
MVVMHETTRAAAAEHLPSADMKRNLWSTLASCTCLLLPPLTAPVLAMWLLCIIPASMSAYLGITPSLSSVEVSLKLPRVSVDYFQTILHLMKTKLHLVKVQFIFIKQYLIAFVHAEHLRICHACHKYCRQCRHVPRSTTSTTSQR